MEIHDMEKIQVQFYRGRTVRYRSRYLPNINKRPKQLLTNKITATVLPLPHKFQRLSNSNNFSDGFCHFFALKLILHIASWNPTTNSHPEHHRFLTLANCNIWDFSQRAGHIICSVWLKVDQQGRQFHSHLWWLFTTVYCYQKCRKHNLRKLERSLSWLERFYFSPQTELWHSAWYHIRLHFQRFLMVLHDFNLLPCLLLSCLDWQSVLALLRLSLFSCGILSRCMSSWNIFNQLNLHCLPVGDQLEWVDVCNCLLWRKNLECVDSFLPMPCWFDLDWLSMQFMSSRTII